MTSPDFGTQKYAFIFAGGGVAALSLALRIAAGPLRGSSMLIVDRGEQRRESSTISFWSTGELPFLKAVSHSWENLKFEAPASSLTIPLGSYRYHTMRGRDFYQAAYEKLIACPNVKFIEGGISRLEDTPSGVSIAVEGREYHGKFAFDSRFRRSKVNSEPGNLCLQMAFRGWDVETRQDVFDPNSPVLMDFRTPASQDVRFFYILPFDSRRALVEYTQFTGSPARPKDCLSALEAYLRDVYGLEKQDYTFRLRESGVLPVTSKSFTRRSGRNILKIGLNGGRLKPSTGYAFTRIQRDSEAIAASLERRGHPFDLPPDSALFSLMDSIMLEVMQRYPAHNPGIFTALFLKNPIERVLRFLDEDASLVEVLRIIASLPPALFLRVLARRMVEPVSKPAIRIFRDFKSNQKGKKNDVHNRSTKTGKQHPSLR